MQLDRDFHRALGRGERWALEAFYQHLHRSKDDDAFMARLQGLLPRAVPDGERQRLGQLKVHLDAPDFGQFAAKVPAPLFAAFMLLALSFAACDEPTQITAESPATSAAASESSAPATTSSSAAAPEATASAQAADAGPKDVQAMTFDELKAALNDYIDRAELPVAEKQRLVRVLTMAPEPKVLQSRSDLAKLFKENEPERIALVLEQMVLFQRAAPRPVGPSPAVRYKGVDFS